MNMDTPLATSDIKSSPLDLCISKERGLFRDNSCKWHHYLKDKLFYPNFWLNKLVFCISSFPLVMAISVQDKVIASYTIYLSNAGSCFAGEFEIANSYS
jgi:hypothetical protein